MSHRCAVGDLNGALTDHIHSFFCQVASICTIPLTVFNLKKKMTFAIQSNEILLLINRTLKNRIDIPSKNIH